MRAGFLISAISHVVLVLLALLGTPKLFDGSVPSITVELVPSDEIESPRNAPEPEKEKPPVWDLPTVPELAARAAPAAPAASAPSAPAQAPAAPAQAPANSRQALLKPQAQATPEPPQGAPAPTPSPTPSIFDPASIPMLLDLPNGPERGGFDAEATTRANLSAEERAAFRAQLRRCWKLPGWPNQATRVVLRIYLRPDARLAGDPVLIEASASRDGPVVMQAALRALKECQPFTFLPPDKYLEWKVLDVSFTPRDMSGG